jgi:hypothetical protein
MFKYSENVQLVTLAVAVTTLNVTKPEGRDRPDHF